MIVTAVARSVHLQIKFKHLCVALGGLHHEHQSALWWLSEVQKPVQSLCSKLQA